MKKVIVVILLTACTYTEKPDNPTIEPVADVPIIPVPPPEVPKEYSVELTWDRPTERENGDQLFIYELGGYEIRYKSDLEYEYLYINNGSTENLTVINLKPITYSFAITAYDIDGLYSDWSDSLTVSLEQ